MGKTLKKTTKPAKNKGGRPPLPAGMAKTARLDDVRFSPAELTGLKQVAAKLGIRWSDYVRDRLGL